MVQRHFGPHQKRGIVNTDAADTAMKQIRQSENRTGATVKQNISTRAKKAAHTVMEKPHSGVNHVLGDDFDLRVDVTCGVNLIGY